MSNRLLEAIHRRPVLLDAAMGTRLFSFGLGSIEASSWNLDRPESVLEIHRLDIEAGSDALLTNTFCAGRSWLDRFGLGNSTQEINRRGVELARLAAGPDRWVLGSIGPTADGETSALIEQAEALVEAGVDALVLETHTFGRAEWATRLLVDRFVVPVIASLHAWPEPVGEMAQRLAGAGASAIGVNCVLSMEEALAVVRKLHKAIDLPLWVKPGRLSSDALDLSLKSFGQAVPELIANSVRLIGGCCGTTDAHVSALRAKLKVS
jgi:methionine synthase I (cobalamin-dependent)